ncbi:glycosyltransferase [Microbacteriaceae bacterium K1510]|nr:glycosyltransferase [Microbacteriaceae bacterium K1510]
MGRGRFWTNPVRDDTVPPLPTQWPSVVVVVPARNEAEHIAASVGSLAGQGYEGRLDIIVVDDDSDDGTGTLAAAAGDDGGRPVTVIASQGLPAQWTGKLWALKQGIAAAEKRFRPDYLLLTDADIVHAPDTVAWLVAKATSGGYGLTSFMAKLRCESLAERMHVPAFIYFFQMLFPFTWVKQTNRATAAAAGGCVLLKAGALRDAGGIDSIRNALIDDCALAQRMKAVGPIWLGLTERSHSIRPYEDFDSVRRMIARSAYAQLRFSPLLLAGTMLGLALTFLAPPLLALFATGLPEFLGLLAWVAMALSMQPTLRFYRVSPLWGLALPVIALLYAGYTLDSAYQHARKRGGQWKGRVHVNAPGVQ